MLLFIAMGTSLGGTFQVLGAIGSFCDFVSRQLTTSPKGRKNKIVKLLRQVAIYVHCTMNNPNIAYNQVITIKTVSNWCDRDRFETVLSFKVLFSRLMQGDAGAYSYHSLGHWLYVLPVS